MWKAYLYGLVVGCTALLGTIKVSAEDFNPRGHVQEEPFSCPVVLHVEAGQGHAHVTLVDSLLIYLRPNIPVMSMRVRDGDTLYKATVDGTMVTLYQCEVHQQNQCVLVDDGGSKSSDLLTPYEWNKIYIKYNNDEIIVDVNGRSKVMRGHMSIKGHINTTATVTFVVPHHHPSYQATLNIRCSDALPEIVTDLPVPLTSIDTPTTPKNSIDSLYDGCPLSRIQLNQPSIRAFLDDSLTLAVYPTQPSIELALTNAKLAMKVRIDESSASLLQCEVVNKKCFTSDQRDIDEFFITPGQWNIITLSVMANKISVSIHHRRNALVANLPSSFSKGLQVIAMVPQDSRKSVLEPYEAYVNVKCEINEQKEIWPTFPTVTTKKSLPTKSPIIDDNTPSPQEPSTPGISRPVVIIVCVLAGVLLVLIVALIITVIKKRRRLAAINEHSPLHNQHQQQE